MDATVIYMSEWLKESHEDIVVNPAVHTVSRLMSHSYIACAVTVALVPQLVETVELEEVMGLVATSC